MKSNPIISIVTVVLNDYELFKDTASNISQLTYDNFEYIVIDGQSTDNTLLAIKEFEPIVDKTLSEKDKGLYDAMNKGIELASGEWVIFMNAGDKFASNKILTKLFKDTNYDGIDILYGNALISYPGLKKHQPAGSIEDIKKGMQFCHQSALIRLDYHKTAKYNIRNKICADFEFFYHANQQHISFLKIDETIANVIPNGISDKNREIVYFNWWKMIGYSNFQLNVLYIIRIIFAFLKRIIKSFLPEKMVYFIIKIKK